MPTYEDVVITVKITADTIQGEDAEEARVSIKEAIESVFPDGWIVVEVV